MSSQVSSTKVTPLRDFDPLVRIQEGRSQPFFCIHGAGGNVLNFRDIATRLGPNQTFYGIQASGVDGGPAMPSIEAMAELYMPAVIAAQPSGRYLLGGYSAGGVVAYELAQQLRRSGREVALLVLLDTFAAHVRPQNTAAKTHLDYFRDVGIKYIGHRLRAKWERESYELTLKLKTRFYRSQNQPMPFELRDGYVSRSLGAAALRYRAEPYDGRVTLYRATEVDPPFRYLGEKLGWEELAPQTEVVLVPGNHDTLVYEPNVDVMISHLRHALDDVSRSA